MRNPAAAPHNSNATTRRRWLSAAGVQSAGWVHFISSGETSHGLVLSRTTARLLPLQQPRKICDHDLQLRCAESPGFVGHEARCSIGDSRLVSADRDECSRN